jgi:hypothetical protein
MTSATTQEIDLTICAHEQLFKASGRVEAEIATTVMKDNNCASGKEVIKGNDQTDNHTTLCKPEDLFLALAHVENELALAWLQKFDGEQKSHVYPIATLSEHHVSENDNGYASYAALDCFIIMDSFGARDLMTQFPSNNAMQDDDWNYESTTNLSMEMRKSSCDLWIIMTLRMANSHMRLTEPQVNHMNGW